MKLNDYIKLYLESSEHAFLCVVLDFGTGEEVLCLVKTTADLVGGLRGADATVRAGWVVEMTEQGLVAVPDPSGLFLADRHEGAPGSAVVPILDGHRPLLVELQALIVPSRAASPRRAAQGIDTCWLRLRK